MRRHETFPCYDLNTFPENILFGVGWWNFRSNHWNMIYCIKINEIQYTQIKIVLPEQNKNCFARQSVLVCKLQIYFLLSRKPKHFKIIRLNKFNFRCSMNNNCSSNLIIEQMNIKWKFIRNSKLKVFKTISMNVHMHWTRIK